MKKLLMTPAMALVLAFSGTALATDDDSMTQKLNEARLEGQLWATYSLNTHLNPFDFEIDVDGDTAVLEGQVEDPVQKDLAEQIALGTSGIAKVENRIEVIKTARDGSRTADAEMDTRASAKMEDDRDFGDRVSDVTTTATVKSKILWNRNADGLSLNVDTHNGHVTLEGTADSEASRELAGRLAANTDGVVDVDNRLVVDAAAVKETRERDVGDTVSDGWITTKVKSTLLFSSNVPGTSINVDTRDGVVSLEGEVESSAEKNKAIRLARDIRGVTSVDASKLMVRATS